MELIKASAINFSTTNLYLIGATSLMWFGEVEIELALLCTLRQYHDSGLFNDFMHIVSRHDLNAARTALDLSAVHSVNDIST